MKIIYLIATATIIVVFVIISQIFYTTKKTYTIALIGDSMIDTMQTSFPFLNEALMKAYPGITFKLYNYGVGGQNIEMGLGRFDEKHVYKDRNYPPIAELKPDIIIVGSWGYNPFGPHDPQTHKKLLTQAIEKVKKTGAKIYLLKEIAPLQDDFGKGVNGVNWPSADAATHAGKIVDQLNNADTVSSEQQIPLINVFDISKRKNEGKKILVNQTDGIHASPTGHRLTANIIASKLQLERFPFYTIFSQTDVKLRSIFDDKLAQDFLEKDIATLGQPNLSPHISLFSNILRINEFTSSTSILRFLKLNSLLEENTTYTVFLPNNNAYERLPAGTFQQFVNPDNITKTEVMMKSHIVKGRYKLINLTDGMVLKTLSGKELTITKKNEKIYVNDAVIEKGDIITSNGVVYMINKVLFHEGEKTNTQLKDKTKK
jgi:uncharacterized surface protein with fasciclin (FAS1) repeats